MKRRNKGFTLIETIVAFAVLGVAVLGIGGFFVSAARSYSSVNDETSLQYEAQLALNQVENMLIDSTLGVSYNYNVSATEALEGYNFVENDAEAADKGAAVSKILYAINVNETDGSKLDLLLLKWVAADKAIYYKEMVIDRSANTISSINIAGKTVDAGWDLLAEDVIAFAVDLSEYEETKKVEIALEFENRSKDYHTTGTVVLRNNVLINEDRIEKIYEHITKVIQSTITGLEIKANTNVTVPGGAVQLSAKVTGTGYPSQDIHQWIVASDSAFENVIYNSLTEYDTRPETYIDTNTLVLYVSDDTTGSGNTFNEMLYVKAVVNTTDDEGEELVLTDELSIGVKLISNIEVSVNVDTTQTYNENLKNSTFYTASLINQRANPNDIPTMTLNPENIVQMSANVVGSDSTLSSADKQITWSLINVSSGVIAEIDNTGMLEINQYSKTGSFVVRASLKLDSTVYVDYKVRVGTEYDSTNSTLVISTEKDTLNRGGNLACGLTLNGTAVDNEDYDWSITVISSNGQEISGSAVTINAEGAVYATYDLSYDYSYEVWINAALKSNPGINDSKKISIPKVSLSVTPMTRYSKMGATVSGITCVATGLEEYDIKWSMSKDANPNYFFTAWGNFNITGSKTDDGKGTATVVMGTESDPTTNCTVKANLKDNTNYSATMRIYTGNVSMNITGGTTVKRNNSLSLDVNVQQSSSTNIHVTKETATWEIVDAKVGVTSRPELIDGTITISKGLLTVGENFAPDYVNTSVVLTIKAYDQTYGLEDTHTVTVAGNVVGIFPQYVLIPDGSSATTIQYTTYSGAYWNLRKEGRDQNNYKVSFNENTGVLTAEENTKYQNDNATYNLTLYLDGQNYYGGVRYGFEEYPTYTAEKRIKTEYKWEQGKNGHMTQREYAWVFRIAKSQYDVLRDGELYPVYYVAYGSYRVGSGDQNKNTNFTKYAFVSYTTTPAIDGSGQWYKLQNGTWSTSDQPGAAGEWNYTYFSN